MKSVKHLVVGPFDIAQAIRELAEAVDEIQAQAQSEPEAAKPQRKRAPKAAENEEG